MVKRDNLTSILAITGTILVWLPILAPVLLSLLLLIRDHVFLFDYLMPEELFPAVAIGGAALLWAAFRARSRRRLIGWGFGIAIAMLVGGQGLAVLTGLASGATEPSGWPWVLVLASLAVYWLAVITAGVGGLLLLGDLFRPSRSQAERS
jgi:hypothetical protein